MISPPTTPTRSPVWHPFTQHGLQEPIPLIERAEGASLWTRDGQRIIDAIASWWVVTHGHCHPQITTAIAEQAARLDQVIFAGWTHEPAERLAAELMHLVADTLGPQGHPLRYLFFSDSGSTAVEVAIKMALSHFVHRQMHERHRVLVMEHSYHGDTIGAMSVGARGVFNAVYQPLLFDVSAIPFPAPGSEQASLDALEAACRAGDAAAFILEPLVLGAGGMLMYDASVLRAMHEICTHHHVVFIADEVMTGWGRTGTLLACQQAGITPDILCLAKGITGGSLPLAVTLASEAIFAAHYSHDRAQAFYHSSSYTANPIACAAGLANLEIWRQEPVMARIATLEQWQQAGLERLAHVPGIGAVRRSGTILALDYDVRAGAGYLSDLAPRLMAFFREAGLLIRPLGNTAYLMPPYAITQDDLTRCHQALAEAAALARHL